MAQSSLAEPTADSGTPPDESLVNVSEPHGVYGGGGHANCTEDFCVSYVGGEDDDCFDCWANCDGEIELRWSTNDLQNADELLVSGSTNCDILGFRWEVGEWRCASDQTGVICRDCGGCLNKTSYCDWY